MRNMTGAGWLATGAALACAAVWAAAGKAQQEATAPQASLNIAVVDTSTVLRSSKEWRDAEEERLRLIERMRRTLTKLSEQVQVLRNQQENLPPGTDEQRQKQQQIAGALRDLQESRREFETQIAGHHSEAAGRMFRKIIEAAEALAEQRGIQLVLRKQSLDLSGSQAVDQTLLLATTEVLYAHPALDISEAVVERINADYPGHLEVK